MVQVLDRDSLCEDLARSPLLVNALALVGSHVNPSIIPHDAPPHIMIEHALGSIMMKRQT